MTMTQRSVANIDALKGNTIVPGGGVAVLYNGGGFEFRFVAVYDAWGSGITLVPVTILGRSRLGSIGLWNSQATYAADTYFDDEPAADVQYAVTSVNFATTNGFPATPTGTRLPGRALAA